ncbi:MAG: L-serine ammonia-lyase, iron-sulfur-dependent, subunit alpha [Candidatus Bipolaricaulota bacterium]|nr:L-serine ammonia-lyase, iron-sulfur-dependent, subunit alpha [Candidatus Bipolaricaulota bacterium]
MSYAIKDILRMEVAPALGCTEPSAVALATAAAASLLPRRAIDGIELWVDPNIYKNGFAVSIPGAEGESGIDLAAALGAFGGDPHLKLEVLRPISRETLEASKGLVARKSVVVNVLDEKKSGIYIRAQLRSGTQTAEAVIEDVHDNIVSLSLDGSPVRSHPLLCGTSKSQNNVRALEEWLVKRTLPELIALLDDLDGDDLAFLREGVDHNVRLAEYGLTYGPGLGVGLALERLVREGLLKKDMILAARILTSAASDARMAGVKMPAMSSAGSGNHGLTAILPIWAVKDYVECDDENCVLRAIALSHVITAHIKAHTGRLSAICGCSIAAGAGATGGITYLMGGSHRHIAGAIKNVIGDLAGVICDGAKAGCSLKLATAAGTAVQSALFALHGLDVQPTDGIVAVSSEETMRNVGQLSTQGMMETDRTILDIMVRKRFEN